MNPLPLVRPLGEAFSMAEAFSRLSDMPARLWLDSAARGPELEPGGDHAGRYSFLCADPVDQIVADAGDETPWPKLKRWSESLPRQRVADLPPFQGGIAGLWGYEAGGWLEAVGHAALDDLPTAAVSVGLYDWVICCDHLRSQAWLISWGLGKDDFSLSTARAQQRMNAVLHKLNRPVAPQPASQAAPERTDADPLAGSFPTHWPNVWSNFSSAGFRAAIGSIIRAIGKGDLFQANLSQRLVTPALSDSDSLALRLRESNPAPFAGFYDGGSFQVISSSPEGFLRLRNGVVQTRPIKGTVARTGDETIDRKLAAGLLASEKERAENVMIVDLMRNDLSRVCEDDSVRVSKLCGVESYAHVQHLVSVVEGSLRQGVSAIDLLEACFPGGSVTGAPKIEAMKTIAQLEPVVRGPYCGSLGYVSCGGDAEFNILIRTITAQAGWWQIPVGGGITLRSDPAAEESETWIKAEGMLRAIG
ncbi:MAG: anthranilate synthase component I family protein [Planctomycetaceae bacterium]